LLPPSQPSSHLPSHPSLLLTVGTSSDGQEADAEALAQAPPPMTAVVSDAMVEQLRQTEQALDVLEETWANYQRSTRAPLVALGTLLQQRVPNLTGLISAIIGPEQSLVAGDLAAPAASVASVDGKSAHAGHTPAAAPHRATLHHLTAVAEEAREAQEACGDDRSDDSSGGGYDRASDERCDSEGDGREAPENHSGSEDREDREDRGSDRGSDSSGDRRSDKSHNRSEGGSAHSGDGSSGSASASGSRSSKATSSSVEPRSDVSDLSGQTSSSGPTSESLASASGARNNDPDA